MQQLVFLVGFMGCGKTYWGKRLAEYLGYQFVDLDEWIVSQSGKSIPDIFAQGGERAFRLLEQQYLRELATFSANWVVATGGGAPCFSDNMDWMNEHGRTIYLNAPTHVLAARLLPEREKRPLLANTSADQLELFIAAKLAERQPFYRKAHQVVHWEADETVFFANLMHACGSL